MSNKRLDAGYSIFDAGCSILESTFDIHPPCTHHAIHNAIRKTSGAYAELIGIGPELMQIHWLYFSPVSMLITQEATLAPR
ncbi:hypothetical protein ES703_114809 [subsurface metagenome]